MLHADLLAGPAGDPDGDRDRQVGVALDRIARLLDELAQLLAEPGRLLDRRLGQDQHELLAAVPADVVAGAEVLGDRLGDGTEHDIARFVAVRVVDRLEVVDVDERDTQRALVARGALDLGEQLGQQRLAVGDAGQAVDGGAVIGVGEGRRDDVDRGTESSLEAAPGLRHGHRVVAAGDLLRGLDQAPIADPHDRPGDQRGHGDADRQGRHCGDDRSRPVVHPRRGELRVRQEQDPDHDRSHERQDPQQAHHLTRLRLDGRRSDSPVVPATPAGSTPVIGAGPAAVRGRRRLLYSGRPHHGVRDPRTRRSAIALAGRIGRRTREMSTQNPDPGSGFFRWRRAGTPMRALPPPRARSRTLRCARFACSAAPSPRRPGAPILGVDVSAPIRAPMPRSWVAA